MKYKVLMLGWEFPPFINGGLGVASKGLAEALSSQTELSLIVPRSDADRSPKPYEIIGLNELELAELKEREAKQSKKLEEKIALAYVDVSLSGYERVPVHPKQKVEENKLQVERLLQTPKKMVHLLNRPEIYGDRLLDKVVSYTELVTRYAQGVDFDIIHAHDWMTFLAGVQIKAQSGKPLVLHVHSLEYDRVGPDSKGWVYDLEKWAMQHADMIIPVSYYTSRIITTYYGISTTKIRPVHNGLDFQESYKLTKPFKEKLIVFMGRFTDQKSPQYFLQAAEKVLASYPNVRFAMAGKGELIAPIVREVARKKLGDRIHFTGFLSPEKVRDLLAMADVFLMPSLSEPFGLAAIEAAQMGVPCVITQQSGAIEVLPHALVAEGKNIDQMADHILRLLTQPKFYDEISAKAKADAANLSWDKAAKIIVKVYDYLLSN